jgi:putative transcriptional regulator
MEPDFSFFKIEYNQVVPRKGRILISEPFLSDTYFKRSIVLLTEHNDEGSVGFVLNKPLDIKVSDVIQGFPVSNAKVCIGGPVNTNSIHFIHRLGHIIPKSEEIIEGIFWGGDFDFMKEMIRHGELQQHDIRFFLGYSGWSTGQLDKELAQNSWVVTDINASQVMAYHKQTHWRDTLLHLGEKYKVWANFPENPSMN